LQTSEQRLVLASAGSQISSPGLSMRLRSKPIAPVVLDHYGVNNRGSNRRVASLPGRWKIHISSLAPEREELSTPTNRLEFDVYRGLMGLVGVHRYVKICEC